MIQAILETIYLALALIENNQTIIISALGIVVGTTMGGLLGLKYLEYNNETLPTHI
jgi:hypothetical protein